MQKRKVITRPGTAKKKALQRRQVTYVSATITMKSGGNRATNGAINGINAIKLSSLARQQDEYQNSINRGGGRQEMDLESNTQLNLFTAK